MSLTPFVAAGALAISSAALAALAWADPKRLRTRERLAGSAGPAPLTTPGRRGLGALALLPGLTLAALGFWPAFLIWLGAASAAGWCAALILTPRPAAKRTLAAGGDVRR